jgi:serine/threonine-protein kinase HipA
VQATQFVQDQRAQGLALKFGKVGGQGSGWRLAPAFDVNPNTAQREHALNVGAPYADTEGALSAAFATHAYYRLTQAHANLILEEVLEAASQWRRVANQICIGGAEQRRMQAAFALFE